MRKTLYLQFISVKEQLMKHQDIENIIFREEPIFLYKYKNNTFLFHIHN